MKLKLLQINRGYGDDGKLRGTIGFVNEDGNELKINLDEQLSVEIVKLCAAAVIRAGVQAAESLTLEARNANLIEHEPSEVDESENTENGDS